MMALLGSDVAVQITNVRVQRAGHHAGYSKYQGGSIGDLLDRRVWQAPTGIGVSELSSRWRGSLSVLTDCLAEATHGRQRVCCVEWNELPRAQFVIKALICTR
jgi:hypothetical protein